MQNYSEVLKSYMIPAQEGEFLNELKDIAKSQIKEAGKEILPAIGAFGIMCVTLGIYSKFKSYKDKKVVKANNAVKDRAMKDAFDRLDSKYKFSSMTKNEYNKFTDKMRDEIIQDISKMLKPLNSNKFIKPYKEKVLQSLKKYNYDQDYIDDVMTEIKSGLFTVDDDWDYVSIISGSQETNIACADIVYDVAEALELKYDEFVKAGLFSVGTGDGDEGCVYPEFVTYETMRKRCNM